MDNSESIHYNTAVVANTSGDNTLVAAQVDEEGNSVKIRVMAARLSITTTGSIRFESNPGGTALTGVQVMGNNGQYELPYNPNGWFETNKGELLNLELSGTLGVGGVIQWIKA